LSQVRLRDRVLAPFTLEDDVNAWIAAWNDNPKPFVWTKTADQILDNLANYCTRINEASNDSGH
jgi:hypothetical protein